MTRDLGLVMIVVLTTAIMALTVYDINYGPILPTNDSELNALSKLLVEKLESERQ